MMVDGLTVILGENGTGKSTILKSLYSLAESPTDLDGKKERAVDDAIGPRRQWDHGQNRHH